MYIRSYIQYSYRVYIAALMHNEAFMNVFIVHGLFVQLAIIINSYMGGQFVIRITESFYAVVVLQ